MKLNCFDYRAECLIGRRKDPAGSACRRRRRWKVWGRRLTAVRRTQHAAAAGCLPEHCHILAITDPPGDHRLRVLGGRVSACERELTFRISTRHGTGAREGALIQRPATTTTSPRRPSPRSPLYQPTSSEPRARCRHASEAFRVSANTRVTRLSFTATDSANACCMRRHTAIRQQTKATLSPSMAHYELGILERSAST